MSRTKWHWPTETGWELTAVLTVGGYIAGGWGGAAIMFGYCAFVNVLGQSAP